MTKPLIIGAVVLAAGAARRMGLTKQLLPYQHTTLVGYVLEQAQQANLDPIVVVVGAQADTVGQALPKTVYPAYNEHWHRGIGSSLACGIEKIMSLPTKVSGVMILLADQPRVEASLLQQYIRTFYDDPCDAVALQYPSGAGVPALFGSHLFKQLTNLDNNGAKAVLRSPDYVIRMIDQPKARLDVDTYEAYQQLLQ